MTLRVIFAGTPTFAIPCLERLVNSDIHVAAVVTQPDRRRGRGQKLSPPPVKSFATEHAIPVIQADRLDRDTVGKLLSYRPDLIIVAAYGLMIPAALLSGPALGCVNVHASLLPRWRGAAPVARAIEAGDTETGVTIMQMDRGLDTGGILSQSKVEIKAEDTTATLEDRIAREGATELIRVLPMISESQLRSIPQNEDEATYAAKMTKADAVIDWDSSAASIVRKVRACNPWPVAHSWLQGSRVRIWEAQVCEPGHVGEQPGSVIHSNTEQVVVLTGQGAVRLETVQKDGRNRMKIRDFLAGNPIAEGLRFTPREALDRN
ncbi:MAG: methionyl-tRNA formyltransferase [Acidiferrobacterales bacterium]|nr:methionyl-tRNA formyltransferase [Acidiferrobacterales bacterium]